MVRFVFLFVFLISSSTFSFAETLNHKLYSQPSAKSIFVPPTEEDFAYGRKIAEGKMKDVHNLKIPDGLFLFMSTDVPIDYWNDMNDTMDEFHASYVLYGLAYEKFQKVKEISAKYVKLGKIPEDKHELFELFPWRSKKMNYKPEWFEELKIKRVPAFVLKDGDDVCIVKGDVSFRIAIREFIKRDCLAASRWIEKNNITLEMLR